MGSDYCGHGGVGERRTRKRSRITSGKRRTADTVESRTMAVEEIQRRTRWGRRDERTTCSRPSTLRRPSLAPDSRRLLSSPPSSGLSSAPPSSRFEHCLRRVLLEAVPVSSRPIARVQSMETTNRKQRTRWGRIREVRSGRGDADPTVSAVLGLTSADLRAVRREKSRRHPTVSAVLAG